MAGALGIPAFGHDTTIEGGTLEWNGAGTVIASGPCLVHRNPGVSTLQIENVLRSALGFTVSSGWRANASDDVLTRGHPDGIARFIDPDTVVVGMMDDPRGPDREVYESAAEILEAQGLRILRMPIPGRSHGLVANYLNWYVARDVVLVGTFGVNEWDQAALRFVAACFPGRSAVGVNVWSLWQDVVGFTA